MTHAAHLTPGPGARCWAEIDLSALRHNARVARELAGPGVELLAVVKADGYGHGMVPVARGLREAGVGRFAVANVGEAAELQDRLLGEGAPVTLLSAALPAERAEIVRRGLRPWVSTLEEAADYARLAAGPWAAAGFGVEVEIDTGMGRAGVLAAEWPEFRRALAERLPVLRVCAVVTHLPSPDEDEPWTRGQLAAFTGLLNGAPGERPSAEIHAQNSAGLLGYGRPAGANFARPGLMLYGASPLPVHQARLRPVLAFKTRVTLVRTLPAGTGVSYGRTFITSRPTRVATLAAGYADGFPRHLSGAGADVLIRGRRCPLLGRVTMDQIMADVSALEAATGAAVAPGEEVVLLGRQGAERIAAAEMAAKAGTIPWEIFTGLTPRAGRFYLDGAGTGS